jgi:hypothetical protein
MSRRRRRRSPSLQAGGKSKSGRGGFTHPTFVLMEAKIMNRRRGRPHHRRGAAQRDPCPQRLATARLFLLMQPFPCPLPHWAGLSFPAAGSSNERPADGCAPAMLIDRRNFI